MRTIARFLVTSLVLLVGTAMAPAASAAGCSLPDGSTGVNVWIKAPTTLDALGQPAGTTRPAGTRLCKADADFVTPIYVQGISGRILVTQRTPNLGGPAGSAGRAHADAAKALAERYGVALQFAAADEAGRSGYVKASAAMLTGTYSPAGSAAPGKGLIRIGNGGANMSVAGSGNNWFRTYLLKVARHEIAHSEIEQLCGTTAPPVAGGPDAVRASTGREVHEHVTDAYAELYIGPTNRGTAGYSKTWDVPRARAIHAGNCG